MAKIKTASDIERIHKLLEFDTTVGKFFAGAPHPSKFIWPMKQTPLWASRHDSPMHARGKSASPIQVIGLDEVGRGPLAGPVVAAAVSLPPIDPESDLAKDLSTLNDSKSVSHTERLRLSEIIKSIAIYAIAEATVEEIDTINILQASLLAMKRARLALNIPSPALLLIDGNKYIPKLPDSQVTVVKGDGQSASIAAASILAKVHRDNLMEELAKEFPDYGWESNKGYGAPKHRQAIKDVGLTVWHRKSFSMGIE
jgi:ribonuclease HII